jgi:transposase
MELTNTQWDRIATIIASVLRNQERRGRPQRHPREVLDGILWVLRTGAPWKDVPQRYPPYHTCHRRFQKWVRQGVFKRIIHELAEDLYERGGIDIRETFIDGSFAPAKIGALLSAIRSVERAPRSWQLQTLLVFLSPLTWRALRRTK